MLCIYDEAASQPDLWRRVAELSADPLPTNGEHITIAGCGASWFIAQAYTVCREWAGKGVGNTYTATEFPQGRMFDRVICLPRSGTATKIIQVMKRLREEGRPALLITVVADGPAAEYASEKVVLDFADETSVVQTRFATSALQYFLDSLEHDVGAPATDAKHVLAMRIPSRWVGTDRVSFPGTEWTIGLAVEAGLKLHEASQSWTEVYPAVGYRHGPTSVAQPGRLTWIFGPIPNGLTEQVHETGAELVTFDGCPIARLVLAQRLAVECALARGLSPDTPRNLVRSVILP